MRLLVIGGTGFLSGTLVREAAAAGHEISIVTRGLRPAPHQVESIRADRKDHQAFAAAIESCRPWDLVVDCIGFDREDAGQDLAVFSGKCRHFAFISTDFVYDPDRRSLPQPENPAVYLQEGYGGKKRQAEEVLIQAGTDRLAWTIFRPGHIYGPGSLLGCLPLHGRDPGLLERLAKNEPLRLVEGGRFLQHPVFAPDLAKTVLSLPGNREAVGKIFNIANPDIVESRRYYEIIAEILGVRATVQEVPVADFLEKNPDQAPFCCHRSYDLGQLQKSGLPVPSTSLPDGLRSHVLSLRHS